MSNNAPQAEIRLRKLPSVAAIVANVELCHAILQAVNATGAHIPPNTNFTSAVNVLWTPAGDGPFDNQFEKWAPGRESRSLKDRAVAIMDLFSSYRDDVTPHPTPLQRLARRLSDERRDAHEEDAQRRGTARRQEQSLQAANDNREGVLGLLPPGRGTGVPSLQDAGDYVRAQSASSMLGQRPRSQNNPGESQRIYQQSYYSMKIQTIFSQLAIKIACSSARPIPPLGPAPQQPINAGRGTGGTATVAGRGTGADVAAGRGATSTAAGRGGGAGRGTGAAIAGRGGGVGRGGGAAVAAGRGANGPPPNLPPAPNGERRRRETAQQRRQRGEEQRNVASQAAGEDSEVRHIDEANGSAMRRQTRQVDNVDVMDTISSSIIGVTDRLTNVLERAAQQRQMAQVTPPVPVLAAVAAVQPPPPSIPSLNDELDSLYKRRKQAEDAGRLDAMRRWDAQIDRIESLEHARLNDEYNASS